MRVADFGLSRLYHGMHTMTGGLGTFQVNSMQLCGGGVVQVRQGVGDGMLRLSKQALDLAGRFLQRLVWGRRPVLQWQGCVELLCALPLNQCVLTPSCVPCLCAWVAVDGAGGAGQPALQQQGRHLQLWHGHVGVLCAAGAV